MPDDILYLKGNATGVDYVVPDVHGCNHQLGMAITNLGPDDRLFIVGDLFDRGPDSGDVYQLIKADPRVFVVKGNHEAYFLEFMRVIQKDEMGPIYTQGIMNLLINGGAWVVQDEGVRRDLEKLLQVKPIYNVVDNILALIRQPNLLRSDLNDIVNYVEQLPYIVDIGVGRNAMGDKVQPFVICHADMPLSDRALADGVRDLTAEQKKYVTEAREQTYKGLMPLMTSINNERTSDSKICYCGHNMNPDRSVRPETNTVNLDMGAFMFGQLLILNHTLHGVVAFKEPDMDRPKCYFERNKGRGLSFDQASLQLMPGILKITDYVNASAARFSVANPRIDAIKKTIQELRKGDELTGAEPDTPH